MISCVAARASRNAGRFAGEGDGAAGAGVHFEQVDRAVLHRETGYSRRRCADPGDTEGVSLDLASTAGKGLAAGRRRTIAGMHAGLPICSITT